METPSKLLPAENHQALIDEIVADPGYVYLLKSPCERVKVGKSYEPLKRINQHRASNPDLEILNIWASPHTSFAETCFIRLFSGFRDPDQTEWFYFSDILEDTFAIMDDSRFLCLSLYPPHRTCEALLDAGTGKSDGFIRFFFPTIDGQQKFLARNFSKQMNHPFHMNYAIQNVKTMIDHACYPNLLEWFQKSRERLKKCISEMER